MNIVIEEVISDFPVLITEEVVQIKISDSTSYFDLTEVLDNDFTNKDGFVPTVDETNGKIVLKNLSVGVGVPEAPLNGKLYGRKDASWEEVDAGGSETIQQVLNNGNTVTDGTSQIFTKTDGNLTRTLTITEYGIHYLQNNPITPSENRELVFNEAGVCLNGVNLTSEVSQGLNSKLLVPFIDNDVTEEIAFKTYVDTAKTEAETYADGLFDTLVGASPTDLDTIQEISAALQNNPDVIAEIITALGNRLRFDVDNQGLSSTEKTNALTNLGIVIADLLNRANHTGTQTISTIDGLGTALSNKVDKTVINVKDFGAIGNGTTNDTSAIQSAIDSELSDTIVLYFPKGNYRVDTQILMWNKFKNIQIKGDGAFILPRMTDNLSAFKIGSSISETTPIYPSNVCVFGVYFDYTNALPTTECAGITFNSILGSLNLIDINHSNFKNNNTVGFEFLNIGNNPLLLKNNSQPGFKMSLCNFYNESLVEATAYNYLNNNTYGIGIKVGNTNADASEYWQIDNCEFFGMYKGVWVKSGANGKVTNSNFQYCNPIISGGSIEDGIVKIENSTDNDGKLIISGCNFNHNFGTGIYGIATAGRPIIITSCNFIANAYLPIKITTATRNIISNCFFDRANLYTSFINPPAFTAIHYIILLTGHATMITGNTFMAGATRCVSSTGSDNVITNNMYKNSLTMTNLTDGVSGNTVQNNYSKTTY